MASKAKKKNLPKLGVSCTDAQCDQKLHAFKPTAQMTTGEIGNCRSCGAAGLVDWERVHERDPGDFAYLRSALDRELIRHVFWELALPEHVRTLAEMLERSVRNRVGPPAPSIYRDGTQTPFPNSSDARIYHYGQHATGTCCRQCLAYWHGIAAEVSLGKKELDYATGLVWRYVDEKLEEETKKSQEETYEQTPDGTQVDHDDRH
jgi:hypothetical protein